MKTKTYMVKVKMIKETEMMVTGISMNHVLMKVSKVMKDSVNKKVDLSKTFDSEPNFKYKVELIHNMSKY